MSVTTCTLRDTSKRETLSRENLVGVYAVNAGTEDLQSSHVFFTSRTGKTADGNDMLAQSIVENWKGLSCVEDLHINN